MKVKEIIKRNDEYKRKCEYKLSYLLNSEINEEKKRWDIFAKLITEWLEFRKIDVKLKIKY